jgi:hypothetical protein
MSKTLEEAARRLMEAARAFLREAQAESRRARGPVTITLDPSQYRYLDAKTQGSKTFHQHKGGGKACIPSGERSTH